MGKEPKSPRSPFVNEKSKINKPPRNQVRKFVVEKTRNRKGWNSKFQDKPLLVTNESDHTVTVGNRVLHKKVVAEVHPDLVDKLFQPKRAPKNTPKYVIGEKKTVFKKNVRFVKENTAGAVAYQVVTLGEDKTKVKSALQLKLAELREKAKIKKKVAQEKEKAGREADEYLFQCCSNLGSPDDTIVNAILTPSKETNDADENNGSKEKQGESETGENRKATPKKIAGDESLVATPKNAIQLYSPPKALPPIANVLPPLVGKKSCKNNRKGYQNSENLTDKASEDSNLRKSERLKRANTVNPMGGIKYV